jgi:Protein of unknown function (DUF3105)
MPAEPTEHHRARRAAGVIATAVVAVAGGIALLLFFVARDDAPVDKNADKQPGEVQGPGQSFADLGAQHVSAAQSAKEKYNSDPPTSGPHAPVAVRKDKAALTDDQILHALELGNVVLVYGSPSAPAGLSAVAEKASGGPFDPALVGAGQAVILARRKGTGGIVGLAWDHTYRASNAADPELMKFSEFWLGRGASG